MNTPLATLAALLGIGLALAAPPAQATDTYEYKPGETRVIDHGLSPDKHYAIAAGIDSKDEFHLYLVEAPSKKRIGPLEEAADALDSGAESLHAAWSPDSRHVILRYRVSRREDALWVYRVENRRAFVVDGPKDLFPEVKGVVTTGEPLEPSVLAFEPKWVSATHFTLHQDSHYSHLPAKPAPALKAYVSSVETGEITDDGNKARKEYDFDFSADGDCELIGGDKYRVASVRPARPR